jgi:hypothetical protein
MSKTRIVRGGGRRQDHFGKAFDGLDRAKNHARQVVRRAIREQFTHDELIRALCSIGSEDWYKALPRWTHAEYEGFRDAIAYDQEFSPIQREQVSAHAYEGRLYRDYEHWRTTFPTYNGSALSGSCVTVWKSTGKVYSGYEIAAQYVGTILPWAE